MIKIHNNTQDIVVQVEEYTNISKIFNLLNLDVKHVLIICPNLFIQRFVQQMHDSISPVELEELEKDLTTNSNNTGFDLLYKGKWFCFSFIITHTELKTINHPINGNEEYKVGFNLIDIK